jgi:serine/threonine protein kinase
MFGLYRTVRLIGKGGMGSVYEAIHTQIERRAAIKVLSKALAGDQKVATRFMNEARAVNIVSHPAMVTVSDFGEQDGVPFIVMEYLEGETLHQRIRSLRGRPMPLLAAAQIIRQIASGLEAAHAKGIIHRDLKPQNIMLVPDPETQVGERVKILDFGIAKFLETSNMQEQFLTNTSSLLGTPMYMAPEQCRNARDVTDRSDVYSLGILAYQMFSGAQPFRGGTDMEIILEHATVTPMSMREIEPELPREIDEMVLAMLSKVPAERPTARQVAQVLAGLLRAHSISSGAIPAVEGLARSQPRLSSLPGQAEPTAQLGSSSGNRAPLQSIDAIDDDEDGTSPTIDAPRSAAAAAMGGPVVSVSPHAVAPLLEATAVAPEMEKTATSESALAAMEKTALSDPEHERTAISEPAHPAISAVEKPAPALTETGNGMAQLPPPFAMASTMPMSRLLPANLSTADTMRHDRLKLLPSPDKVASTGSTLKTLIAVALIIALLAFGLLIYFDIKL